MKKGLLITCAMIIAVIAILCYAVYDMIMFNRYVSGLETENSDLKEVEYNKILDDENAKVSEGLKVESEPS